MYYKRVIIDEKGKRHIANSAGEFVVMDVLIKCGVSRPLHIVEAYGSEDFSSKIKRCDVPSGWTYADSQGDVINNFDYFTDKFLNQCPKDL